jgi:hypothetical protein
MDQGRLRRVRFDIVVFDANKMPVAIIECKDRLETSAPSVLRGRQARRYAAFQVPIVICDRLSRVEEAMNEVVAILRRVEKP